LPTLAGIPVLSQGGLTHRLGWPFCHFFGDEKSGRKSFFIVLLLA